MRRPWLEGPPSCLFWLLLRRCRRWRHHGGVFDGIEELTAEVVHAGGELTQPRGELVVANDGGDGDDQTCGGSNERLGDARGDGAESGCACGAEPVEGIDDAHHRAEESDEGRDGGDSGKPGHAALHRSQGFARGCLCRAFQRNWIPWQAASAVLTLVLVVDLAEDRHQWAGLELVGDRGDLAEARRFAEGANEPCTLGLGSTE